MGPEANRVVKTGSAIWEESVYVRIERSENFVRCKLYIYEKLQGLAMFFKKH